MLGLIALLAYLSCYCAFKICKPLEVGKYMVSKSLSARIKQSTSLASVVGSAVDEGNIWEVKRDFFRLLPQMIIARKVINLWGVFFGIQCWALMFCWLFGMLLVMPLKFAFGDRFDSEGLFIDGFGRWWSRLTTFPHSIPRLTGRENIPWGEPCIYVANHASWMDIPYIGGYMPALKFVGKQELLKIPVLGQSIAWGQHIVVDRKSMAKKTAVLELCIERLKRGISVCLFPEGTRSQLPNAEMLPFSKGAFLIAQQAKVRMVPISLSHTGEVMPCDALFPLRPAWFLPRVHVHPPVETANKSIKELRQEVREIIASEIEPPLFPNSAVP